MEIRYTTATTSALEPILCIKQMGIEYVTISRDFGGFGINSMSGFILREWRFFGSRLVLFRVHSVW
jgi:hypothetical protein